MTLETGVKALAEAVAVDVKALDEVKVDKELGKQLSDENYTLAEKNKLSGVAVEATKNRDDSANADKVHTHTMAQVTGLDTALSGKAATTDPRFTDAREWSAATISQAEVEEGTATTRHAFTAQRLRQGIAAWFTGISGTLGRTILGRSTAEQVRGDLELGTSATKNVGLAVGDVMEVGVGQTWQNMNENRWFETAYTNTTGRPIVVSISSYTNIYDAGLNLFVDDVLAGAYFADIHFGSQLSAEVPAGSTYYAEPDPSGSIVLHYWAELR